MTDATWTNKDAENLLQNESSSRVKFVVGGILLFSAIVYLIVNAMSGNTQLFKTVDEFYADQSQLVGRDLRIAGWVIGDSIEFEQIDANNSRLEFDVVDNIENPGQILHIVALNEPKPDLLQNKAQALVEGRADGNGDFIVNSGGLLLKCPTRYEELEPPTG